MEKRQPLGMAAHVQKQMIYPTPVLENLLFFEQRNKNVAMNGNATIGDPHPNTERYPHHRLSHIEAMDNNDEWYRYYYVCPFEFQDLYNAKVDIQGDGYEYLEDEYVKPKNFYKIERTYVFPRETKVSRPDDYAPDPVYGDAAVFVYQEAVIHEDPRIRNLFDVYKRIYETLPGFTQSRMSAPSSMPQGGLSFGAAQQFFRRTRTQVRPPMPIVAYEALYKGEAVTGFEKTEFGLVEEYHIDGLYKSPDSNGRKEVESEEVDVCRVPEIFVKRRHKYVTQKSSFEDDLPEIVPDASESWSLTKTREIDDDGGVQSIEYQRTRTEGVARRTGWEVSKEFGMLRVEYYYISEEETDAFIETHKGALDIEIRPDSGCYSLAIAKYPMQDLKYSYWTTMDFTLPKIMVIPSMNVANKWNAITEDLHVGSGGPPASTGDASEDANNAAESSERNRIGVKMKYVITDSQLCRVEAGHGAAQGKFPTLVEVEFKKELDINDIPPTYMVQESYYEISGVGASVSGSGLTNGGHIGIVISNGRQKEGWTEVVYDCRIPPSIPRRIGDKIVMYSVDKVGLGYIVEKRTIYINLDRVWL